MWTVNHTKELIGKLKSGIGTLLLRVSLQQKKSDRIWQSFLKSAGICRECWHRAGYSHEAVRSILTILCGLSLLLSSPAQAAINPESAQKAIIGEAANQGLIGMIAVSEVIRRRGNLKGLYGLKRGSFISEQPKWVHDQARKAWKMSANTNITKGATHFENVDSFGKPSWTKKMKKTVKIKDHVFYKEVRP